jgi:16S rRNA (cytosine1402-N4)-methyltransferase
MDPEAATTAAAWIEVASEDDLATVFHELGEERFARKIAREIVARRRQAPLRTTADLAAVVRRCVTGRKPVASLARVFQGVRMWVNGELENLNDGMRRALGVLAPGSLFAILSYHSLEDRAVKQFFRRQVDGCVCPRGLPRCGCGFVPGFRLVTRKALQAGPAEVAANPRARSVRLRALQRAA